MTFWLTTTNYRLRPLTVEDATPRYLGWLQDPQVARYLEARHRDNSIESIFAYITSHDGRTGFLLGIFTPAGEHIGNYSLRIDAPNGVGTLGVLIGEHAHWGREVVIETRAAVLDWAFGTLGLHKVCGACLATNLPAIYNYRRQGWVHEGTRREQAVGESGNRVDVVMFGMLARAWHARSEAQRGV